MLEIINGQMNGIQLGRHMEEYGGKRKVKKKVLDCVLDEHNRIRTLDSYEVEKCMINGELVQASHFEEFLRKHQPSLQCGVLYAFFEYNLRVFWNSEVRKTMQVRIYHESAKEFMETKCFPAVCEQAERQKAGSNGQNT